ncbi:MAG: hypothetical protein GWO11_01700 [Desulfuromonadales bacterium]|nr:hypothetical protein [Desulfuromonadales bacterium]
MVLGGRRLRWEKGDGIDLDEETIQQRLHPDDYEPAASSGKLKKMERRKPRPVPPPEPDNDGAA